MARDSQGQQVALIGFAIISVLLLVVCFLTWRGWQQSAAEAAQARQQAQSAQANLTRAATEIQDLRYMLSGGAATLSDISTGLQGNYDDNAEMKQIVESFRQHMALFGENFEGNRNYQKLPEYLITVIQDLNQQIAQRDATLANAIAERDRIQKDAQDRVQAANASQQRAAQDLEAARQTFQQDLAQLRAQTEGYQQQLAEKDKRINELTGTLNQQRTTTDQEMKRLTSIIDLQKDRIEGMEQTDFDTPHGKIVTVDQRARKVWINLGSADGLRRQMTFSVYGQDENGVITTEKKGSVEVTQIVDQHLAEARIVEDSMGNLIMPGDGVHTPAWQPGRKLRFALVGEMDVNNDGQDDRQLVKDLIETNNGTVDAEVLPSGERTGTLSPQTRYLVYGSTADEAANQQFRDSWTQVTREAQQYGVARISLDEFLNLMGWKGQVRTVNLGRGARAEDFQNRSGSVAPQSTGTTSGLFRERTPPARGRNGAF